MIDGHAHLNEIAGIDDAMRRAVSAGVKRVIAVGMDIASNLRNLEPAKRFPDFVLPAVGYHPWSIATEEAVHITGENTRRLYRI